MRQETHISVTNGTNLKYKECLMILLTTTILDLLFFEEGQDQFDNTLWIGQIIHIISLPNENLGVVVSSLKSAKAIGINLI